MFSKTMHKFYIFYEPTPKLKKENHRLQEHGMQCQKLSLKIILFFFT